MRVVIRSLCMGLLALLESIVLAIPWAISTAVQLQAATALIMGGRDRPLGPPEDQLPSVTAHLDNAVNGYINPAAAAGTGTSAARQRGRGHLTRAVLPGGGLDDVRPVGGHRPRECAQLPRGQRRLQLQQRSRCRPASRIRSTGSRGHVHRLRVVGECCDRLAGQTGPDRQRPAGRPEHIVRPRRKRHAAQRRHIGARQRPADHSVLRHHLPRRDADEQPGGRQRRHTGRSNRRHVPVPDR